MITDYQLEEFVKGSECFESKEQLQLFLNDFTLIEQENLVNSIVGKVNYKFIELFPHRYKWTQGIGCPESGTKVDWVHIPGRLSDEVLMSNWSSPNTYISVSFGTKTRYIVLDIDTNSRYHWTNKRIEIESALESVGINQVNWYQSSESGGLHGYIIFPCDVSSFGASCIINKCLREAEFEISDGDLEVYPNMKTWGSGYKTIRLPVQKGFGCDLTTFLEDWVEAEKENDASIFISHEQEAREWVKTQRLVCVKENGFGSASDWYKNLEEVINEGWTGYSQTNEILGRIAQYHRIFDEKALDVGTLADLMVDTATRCPGYRQYCQHKNDINRRCKDWAKSAWRRYKPFGTINPTKKRDRSKPPQDNQNLSSSSISISKVIEAVNLLSAEGKKINVSSVSRVSKLNPKTVNKYKSFFPSPLLHSGTGMESLSLDSQVEVKDSLVPAKELVDPPLLHSDLGMESLDNVRIIAVQKDSIIESQMKDEKRCKEFLDALNNRFSPANIINLLGL